MLKSDPWDSCKQAVVHDLPALPGWCSPAKACLMMDLVREHGLRRCVDIGAFGGSSCIPLAEALEFCGEGTAYAVDAWSHEVALEGWSPDTADYRWWSAIDLERLHTEFCDLLVRRGLAERCVVMRMRSIEAAAHFGDGTIDFIHLDGSHHEDGFMADVQTFLPKLRDGGMLLVNDANWLCMRRGLAFLLERMRVVSTFLPSIPFLLLVRDVARERRAASLFVD